MKFVLPMAVTLLLIQLAAAFCISKNQGAKIEQDLYTRGQGLVEAIAGISATFLINYDMTTLEDIVTSLPTGQGAMGGLLRCQESAINDRKGHGARQLDCGLCAADHYRQQEHWLFQARVVDRIYRE